MRMILVLMNLFFALTAFAQSTTSDGSDGVKFECDKDTVMKYAAEGARKDYGLKRGTSVQIRMKPWSSEESLEAWMVSVRTKEITVEYLITLEKKITDDGNIVCGIF